MTVASLARSGKQAVVVATYATLAAVPIAVAALVLAFGTDLGDAGREVMWNIAGWARFLLYALAVVLVVTIAYGYYRRSQLWRLGKPENRADNWAQRVRAFVIYGVGQGRLPGDLYASVMHLLIFWGWVVLFIGTAMLTVHDDFYEYLTGTTYLGYSLTLDIFGVLAAIGLIMALVRRYVMRPSKLRLASLWDDEILLWLMLAIVLTGFLVEGLRIGVTELEENPDWAGWSPVGWVIAKMFTGAGAGTGLLQDIHQAFWWFHIPLAFGWIAWVGYGKISHIVLGSANIFTRRLSPTGAQIAGAALQPITDFKNPGVARLQDFTWKQLMQADVCVRCGRCEDNCPAHANDTLLTPMGLLQDIRGYMSDVGPRLVAARRKNSEEPVAGERNIAGDLIPADIIWDCFSCGACEGQCPFFSEHISFIVALRRQLVDEGTLDAQLSDTLMGLSRYGNSLGQSEKLRGRWTEGLDFAVKDVRQEAAEYLWFVGDQASYNPAAQEMTRAAARVFHRAGVDFGIMYEGERSAGNDVRRVGEEGLFELLAEDNIQALGECQFQAIVTTDPHTFNTLKNEYPAYGGQYRVCHYTELLADLLNDGKLKPARKPNHRVTYHDPCYLGRYNGVFDAPRRVLKALGMEVVEMERSRERSYCCGAGGGHLWMQETGRGTRPSEDRIREAVALGGVQYFVVACPKDVSMFQDAVKTTGHEGVIAVRDIVELVEEALEEEGPEREATGLPRESASTREA
jgi:Fe-S oxidoreductase/nitrate reductase gamma subunit